MNLTKTQWTIIGVIVAVILVWYFFLRKKKGAESSFGVISGGKTSKVPITEGWFDVKSGYIINYETEYPNVFGDRKALNLIPGCTVGNPSTGYNQWMYATMPAAGQITCAVLPLGSKVNGKITPTGQFEVAQVQVPNSSVINMPNSNYVIGNVRFKRPILNGQIVPRYKTVQGAGLGVE